MFNGLNAILYDLLYFVKVDTTLCPQIYSLFNPFIQVCLSMYDLLLGPGIKVCSTVGMDEIPPQPAENLLIPPPPFHLEKSPRADSPHQIFIYPPPKVNPPTK